MLRALVVGLGLLFIAGAIAIYVALPHVWPAALECAIFGALILAGTLLEQTYRSRRNGKNAPWQDTGERFIDPTSGVLTQVRYNAKTGERSYEPVDGNAP